MRLIDADSFLKDIKGWQEDIQDNEYDANKFDFVFERIYEMLEEIPAAYDIDEVVEELEEMIHPKQLYFCKYAKGGCKHLYNDDKDCMECVVENAIEIVKHGGVSDDVCEWKIFDNSLTDEPQWVYETACGKYVGEEHTSKAFVYCPYCSKKIKVVEQMDEDELRYCHNDDTDEYHDCLDYMECEECPYYYADLDQVEEVRPCLDWEYDDYFHRGIERSVKIVKDGGKI